MINLLGGIAACISFILFLPQAAATWRNRNNPQAMAAMSVGTQLLIVANATIWLVYAWLTAAFWVGAPGLVNGPLAIMTIWLVTRARRSAARKAGTGCPDCGWNLPGTHNIQITTPPGYGSIVSCSSETAMWGSPIPATEGIATHA